MKVMEKLTPDVKITIQEFNEIGSGGREKVISLTETNLDEVYEMIMKLIKQK